MIDLDRASVDRILPATPGAADWDDVLSRFRARQGRRRRRIVVLAAASLLLVTATATGFGTVRDLFSDERRVAVAATWSPDGRRIGFVTLCTRRCSGRVEVNVMNANGGGQRRLWGESGFETFLWIPVWSPDWRTIAFVRGRGEAKYPNAERDSDIYVTNPDGSGRRRLTQSPQRDGDPVWSPDGRRLAFVRVRDGFGDIYLVNVDGSGLRRLARAISPFVRMPGGPPEGFRANPAWSPDGRRIAFVSNRDGNNDIFVVNADGSGLRNLTRSRANDRDPVWSPDGHVIAFQGRRARPSEVERAACRGHCLREEIYAVNADGSGLRRLTRNWKTDSPAAWSPDGRKILVLRSGHPDVWVMNADGSGKRNLTTSVTYPLAIHQSPAWSPNGRKILFVSNRGDGNRVEVYVMNADGSGKRKLTRVAGRD